MRDVMVIIIVCLMATVIMCKPWDEMCTVKSGIATCFKQPPDGIMSDGLTSGSMIRTFRMLIRVNTIALTPSKFPKLSLVTGFAVCKQWQMFQGLSVNGKKCPSIIPDTKTYHYDDLWLIINTTIEYVLIVICCVVGLVVMVMRRFYKSTTSILQDLAQRVIGGSDGIRDDVDGIPDDVDGQGQDNTPTNDDMDDTWMIVTTSVEYVLLVAGGTVMGIVVYFIRKWKKAFVRLQDIVEGNGPDANETEYWGEE